MLVESVSTSILKDKWMFMGWRGISSHSVPACLGLLPGSLSGSPGLVALTRPMCHSSETITSALRQMALVCFVLCCFCLCLPHDIQHSAWYSGHSVANTGMGSLFSAHSLIPQDELIGPRWVRKY